MKKVFSLLTLLPAFYLLNPNLDTEPVTIAVNETPAPGEEEQFIDWSAAKRLVWDDFKAPPVKNSDAAALTATHLGFSYSFVKDRVSYDIICRFDKTRSWGLVKNDWILKHEQGHFDIAEIFARRLNQAVMQYEFNRKTFQKDLDQIYKSVVEEKEAFQNQYDTETDYSRNKKNQNEWLKKIEKELEESKDWGNYR